MRCRVVSVLAGSIAIDCPFGIAIVIGAALCCFGTFGNDLIASEHLNFAKRQDFIFTEQFDSNNPADGRFFADANQ